MTRRILFALGLVALFISVSNATLHAQSGSLSGIVIESASGRPLSGATIRLTGTESAGRENGAIAGRDGRYTVKGIAPGRYQVSITYLSYASFQTTVNIQAGVAQTLNATLSQMDLGLGEVVVSASRRPEKVTDAPASVSVVDARKIEEQPSLTIVDHIKGIPGVDIVQSGLMQSNVVVRGFNNAFSGELMTLTDNRYASVPSLRVNAYNFIPLVDEDIQQIEIIRGPGSALYGPNAAQGVLQTITRSPFSSAGTWVSLTGGERSVFNGAIRQAGTIGDRVGYKVSAQYMRGQDWGFNDPVEVKDRADFLANNPTVNRDTLKIGNRDSTIERVAAEVRMDFIPTDDMTAIVTFGINDAIKNTDITGVGGAQARNWTYTYVQGRLLYKDLFIQAFLNSSGAGESYLLRTGQPIIDRSKLYAAQIQNSTEFGTVERLTYGADVIRTTPVTDSSITGRYELVDNTTEVGGYVQSETKIVDKLLNLVTAARLDYHSFLDAPVFSPRAALVFTPTPDQTLRATFNRAFTAPTTNDMYLDIIGGKTPLFNVRATSTPKSGYHFNGGLTMRSYSALNFDPTIPEPLANAARDFWLVAQAYVKPMLDTHALPNGIDNIKAPGSTVGVEMKMLNPTTEQFYPVAGVNDLSAVRPTVNQTFELGYQGVVADRITVSFDMYTSHYKDFIGPIQPITPNVFYQHDPLQAYLNGQFLANGMDSANARKYALQIADSLSALPLGTVTPQEQTNDPSAVTLASKNYGELTLYGYDLGLRVAVASGLTLNGSLSYVDKNFFANLDGVSDLSLNAPKFKFSVGADYQNLDDGINASVLMRHVDGFRVNSGDYVGSVPGYSVVDATFGYKLPWIAGLNFTLTAQNLLTFVEGVSASPFTLRHAEFVGTPPLGRLMLARFTYAFK